jgi:ABC-type branched-subunit amino acid transport system substrate-binding protein
MTTTKIGSIGRKLVVALGCWIGLSSPAKLWAGEDLVIGMSAAFNGPSRALGIELYRGARAYFDEVNQAGGIAGRKIVLKAYDDGYNPDPAVANTIRLIEQDKAFLLFGYVGTPTVTRILPLLKHHERQSAYLFFPFTGAGPLRQPPYGRYVFNLRASYGEEIKGLVDHFVAIGRKKIAVFYQIDAYGRSGWEGIRRALTAHGLSLAEEATYRRGTTFTQSLRQQVEILRRADPDAVIAIGAYAACAAFIRDARDAGWDVPIANISFVGSESLLALLQEAGKATGKDYTGNLINSQVVPSYHDLQIPAVRQYRSLMDRSNPVLPSDLADPSYQPLSYSFVGFEGFLDAKLLVEILKRMDAPFRKDRLAAVVESMSELDLGIGFPVSFGPGKHQASDRVYYTVMDGTRFVPLLDWRRWQR